ncbi:MAG: putative 2OG-Fe(II) oxygenase [Halofilum sp. (in: g-proteobacteria)]|nr:putative 2OG-Fe(II) oxygenase [Halofilum sp. (in: g-proteobacteria)]
MSDKRRHDDVMWMWPTPILRRRFDDHQRVNAALIPEFERIRSEFEKGERERVFASPIDLHERVDTPEMKQLLKFFMDTVFGAATQANRHVWPRKQDIRIGFTGCWFQITNGHGFHETHIHGNCSWSAVYYVQAGDPDPEGRPQGATRFYGPYMDAAAGGHGDAGNMYLQHAHWDSPSEDGVLVLFPPWIKHTALPYAGERDRIIISFNATVHSDVNQLQDWGFN